MLTIQTQSRWASSLDFQPCVCVCVCSVNSLVSADLRYKYFHKASAFVLFDFLFYFSYSLPLLHLLLCDTLLISDVHSGLIHWVRHIKTLEMSDTDSYELVQTVSAICAGFPNKRRDLLHEQGCKIPANQSIMGTKSINKWEVRMCVPGRNVATQMVPGITPACVHTCTWGSVGLALWSGLLPGCFRTFKSLFSPAKHWSISTAAGMPQSPVLEKCQTVWGQASWATHPVESAKTLQLPELLMLKHPLYVCIRFSDKGVFPAIIFLLM